MKITRVTVVLAVAEENQHAAHLCRLSRLYFGAAGIEQTTIAGALTPAQRRVLALFRRFGDCAYTEVRCGNTPPTFAEALHGPEVS